MEHIKKSKKSEIQELTATMQRLQADFENYKKRVDKEKQLTATSASAAVIKQLLPVLDAFELALKNNSDQAKFKHGVELIYTQLIATLKDQGLKPIQALGQKLDPTKHEVLLQETIKDHEDEQIIEELQKGYMLNENIIRTSKVKIARLQKEETNDNKGNTAQHHH
jgi:molecular chaperone GrpE